MRANKLFTQTFVRVAFTTVFALVVFTSWSVAHVNAQSALDGFDPNADGDVRAIVVQADGKIIIGGDFNTVSPNGGATVTRNRIARFNPDGTLDTTFDPNASGNVRSIAVQADGKILVGGFFTNIGGQPRNNIARLDATTGLADSFNPNASGSSSSETVIFAIAVQANGKILVGGFFFRIGGQPRNNIARLDAATGLADSFDPNADLNGAVYSIAVQADGKILVGGIFSIIGGQTRNYIARLDGATGLADSFNPNPNGRLISTVAVQADGKILVGGGGFSRIGGQPRNNIARLDAATGLADSFDPNANSQVNSIAVQSDGKILASGFFTFIGGQSRNYIARIDAATGLADSFAPNANSTVYSIAVQTDGKVLAGGFFTATSPNGGAAITRNRIARFERGGLLDRTLDLSTVGNSINTTAIQPDGKIIIGGRFTSVLGTSRNNIARLNTDGTLDTAFNPNANGSVFSIAVQPDGKILAGGGFTTIGGQPRSNIARLDAATGAADSFNPNANGINSGVYSIAVQSDGKILAGGFFTDIGGQSRNYIARLDAATGLADSFNPNPNNPIYSIAVQSDGRILASGQFTNIGGQTRNYIARLDAATGAADSFNPNAGNFVNSIAVQSDGRIVAGGSFSTIGGQSRNRIARLEQATGLADSFNPNANNDVNSIAVQSDGRILAGGTFTSIGGQPRNYIARLDAATGAADSFNPNANGINSLVNSIAVQPDGKILAGGQFTTIGGQSRNFIARLSNDTAALSTLSVTGTTVTLARSGSAAQFTRVIFELSTDNGATYTTLGTATNSFTAPQASAYTLTGQNLPAGQNILIRARGFYRTGYLNGSETIEDKVQNAFLLAPRRALFDFDGDGRADVSVFRPSNGTWFTSTNPALNYGAVQFGAANDKLVPADYDGDGKTDVAVYRDGNWYLNRSLLGFTGVAFGNASDIPVPADYDGDGKSDIAVFRPSSGVWYLQQSTGGFTAIAYGLGTDKPVPADYDGDGRADLAVFRPSNGTWYLQRSQLGFAAVPFGLETDAAVPADYDGDGRTDIAVFRNGTWYLNRSRDGFTGITFGFGTDTPTPADYDGDGSADVAVFRNGVWYLNRTTAGFTGISFGLASDKPIPNSFVR